MSSGDRQTRTVCFAKQCGCTVQCRSMLLHDCVADAAAAHAIGSVSVSGSRVVDDIIMVVAIAPSF